MFGQCPRILGWGLVSTRNTLSHWLFPQSSFQFLFCENSVNSSAIFELNLYPRQAINLRSSCFSLLTRNWTARLSLSLFLIKNHLLVYTNQVVQCTPVINRCRGQVVQNFTVILSYIISSSQRTQELLGGGDKLNYKHLNKYVPYMHTHE